MRVLVVDDEKRLARSLRAGLEAEGFAVDVAHDGTDGLWLARENPYDAIVLDLMLPRMDGIEVCKKLREEARKSTPVLMLTARDTLDEKLNQLRLYLPEEQPNDGFIEVLGGDAFPNQGNIVPGGGNSIGYEDLNLTEALAFLKSVVAGQPHDPGFAQGPALLRSY